MIICYLHCTISKKFMQGLSSKTFILCQFCLKACIFMKNSHKKGAVCKRQRLFKFEVKSLMFDVIRFLI